MITVAPLPTVPTSPIQDYKPPTTTTNPDAVDQGAHAFKSPGPGDLRSPCPALDALANHSYIHHDGRNISYNDLVSALRKAYGISFGFAHFLTMGSFILLRRSPLSTLDLQEVALYNGRWCIAHNCALVHGDAEGHKCVPSEVNKELVRKLVNKEYDPPCARGAEVDDKITEMDIAYARLARAAICAPNDAVHTNIARGEFAMVINIFRKGMEKEVSRQDLEVWLNEGRFPDGWAPNHTETLFQTAWENEKMRELMVKIQQTTGQEHKSWWSSLKQEIDGFIEKVASAAHLNGNGIHTSTASEEAHSH